MPGRLQGVAPFLPPGGARGRFPASMLLRLAVVTALVALAPAFAEEPDDALEDLPATKDDAGRRMVLQLMKENRVKYGEDAALLQGLLLTHSLQGDAILTTESTIVGFEETDGRKYVAFKVASGIVLNDRKLASPGERLEKIWHVVLERALTRYPSFQAPGDGLAVEVHYNHKSFHSLSDLYENVEDVGPLERVKFYMLASDLSAYVEHRLTVQEFLERSKILLDGEAVRLRLAEVPLGPPAPP